MINLDKIQSMWQEDCKIDIDNMHEESIKVPNCIPNIMRYSTI